MRALFPQSLRNVLIDRVDSWDPQTPTPVFDVIATTNTRFSSQKR